MLIEILKAILFGIVEGITEWLPISSTGHLILLDEFIKLDVSPEFYEMFQVVIQLGAILAVVVLFFHKLNPFSSKKGEIQKKKTWDLWFKVVVAVIPSAVLGLLLDDWMDAHLYNYVVVAVTLILYGVAFIFVEKQNKGLEPRVADVHAIDYRTALLIGAFQCLSLIPGTSRSGSPILGGILVPTSTEVAVLITGCVVSFIVSMVVIKALMEYVRKRSFSAFGVYRIILGAVVIGYYLVTEFVM